MMGSGNSAMSRVRSDFLTLDNGVAPCAEETRSPKRLKRESHPCDAPYPIVSLMRGGKARGGDEAE